MESLGTYRGTIAYFTNLGMSPAGFWAWFAACAEVVLGAALILGIATRYAAIASFVWVLVATVTGRTRRPHRLGNTSIS
jgi:uncharacterized membrane protein YphA (DoxX/SURF4 family)